MTPTSSAAHALRALPTMVRVSMADHFAYRAEMAIWILTSTMPLIMLALWNAVVADGAIMGFGAEEMARYFTATLICRQLTGAWVLWELAFQIRTGALSAALMRPVHPLLTHAVWMITAMPYRLAILSPLVVGLAVWRPDLVTWPGWPAAALFVWTIGVAWLTTFLTQVAFGAMAFWLDKVEGPFGVWFSVWMVASGYLAPLSLFPPALQGALSWSPFRGLLALPVELLGGFLRPEDALFDVAVQGAWLLVTAAVASALWRAGLRRYGAFGA